MKTKKINTADLIPLKAERNVCVHCDFDVFLLNEERKFFDEFRGGPLAATRSGFFCLLGRGKVSEFRKVMSGKHGVSKRVCEGRESSPHPSPPPA